ncbi:hypothetical protein ACHAXR_001245, partial [Thalassiosira sp. AJA248-18]
MSKGHLTKFFPGKLRIMLDQVDELGLSHGSSWVSEGRAFAIHDPDIFMTDIAPHFFDKQTHLRSFHRQLSIWGFTRLETGAGGRGVWFHKHFIRDQPELIKHIKRVPVKNPKPTLSTPKNQLPDYTNYRLPLSFKGSPHAIKGHHSAAVKPSQVHQPHRNVAAAASAGKGILPESELLPSHAAASLPPPPQDSLDYLSALSRLPPAVSSRYSTTQVPVSAAPPGVSDQARRYPSFMLTNYQPPVITSMNRLPSLTASNPCVPSAPSASDLGEVAQQLLACRANNVSSQISLGDGSNNQLNAAILSMIMDSRRRDTPPSSNGMVL